MLDWLEFIGIAIVFLMPVWFLLFVIDKEIKPRLKKIRHDLLYILVAETICFLYTIVLGKVCDFLNLRIIDVIGEAMFGTYMLLLLLMIFTAFVTAIWWGVYFVGTLFKRQKTNEI